MDLIFSLFFKMESHSVSFIKCSLNTCYAPGFQKRISFSMKMGAQTAAKEQMCEQTVRMYLTMFEKRNL